MRLCFDYKVYSERLKDIDYEFNIRSGFDWKDSSFPPDQRSIVDEMLDDNPRIPDWENFVFKRPKDIYGERGMKFTIFDNIRPDDVLQGKCGDCYFLSSLSALAENPQKI